MALAGYRPEKDTVRVGYMSLTDCASLVMASVLGIDEKYGIKIVLSREASWSGVRDKLTGGGLDVAHALYGLVYGAHMGIGTQQKSMAVLMNLSQNGQAITLSRQLAVAGALDGPGLAERIRAEPRRYTFAHTFPTGNHAMLLYYWLAAAGIDPLRQVQAVTVPPTQMVANLRAGHMDGFCAGEPWGHRAVLDGVGVTIATSQQVWPEHPGKVLGASADFVAAYPNTCRALTAAVLEASRWLDAGDANREAMTEVIASPAYLNIGKEVIGPRILGHYDNGLGKRWQDKHSLRFYDEGTVNFPYLSDGMWFLTQHRRWGLLNSDPDYLAVASTINQLRLYREAAEWSATPLPPAPMRSSTLIDGVVWDGSDPAGYAAAFPIHAR